MKATRRRLSAAGGRGIPGAVARLLQVCNFRVHRPDQTRRGQTTMKNPHASSYSAGSAGGVLATQRSPEVLPSETAGARDLDRMVASRFAASLPDESLVVDDRSSVTPAQMVESKLMSLLQGSSLPVSHLQMRGGILRGRPGQ